MFCKNNHKFVSLQNLENEDNFIFQCDTKCKFCVKYYISKYQSDYMFNIINEKECEFAIKKMKFMKNEKEYGSKFYQIYKFISKIHTGYDKFHASDKVHKKTYKLFLKNTDCLNDINLNKLLYNFYTNKTDKVYTIDNFISKDFKKYSLKNYDFIELHRKRLPPYEIYNEYKRLEKADERRDRDEFYGCDDEYYDEDDDRDNYQNYSKEIDYDEENNDIQDFDEENNDMQDFDEEYGLEDSILEKIK
jgi:hypothetical protein